jgi:L-cysteine S-thiosulfotransferase
MIKRQLAQLSVLCFVFVVAMPSQADQRQSTTALMTPSNQAMQQDINLNPALFWIMDGEALWGDRANPAGKACADCHQDPKQSMKGVAATFPKRVQGKLLNLEGQINQCRTSRQQSPAFAYESKSLLALSTLIAYQSRGLPIAASTDNAIEPDYKKGQSLYFQRMGQLNLSCAQCHDDRAGLKLAGSTIPQAHPTAYPIYRIEWQGVGSLQRRLRNCASGVRAEQYAYGSPELVALELYLMRRANGMQIESPGVRP